MTTSKILTKLERSGKKVKLTQLYKYFADFGIKPIGPRQRPQHYPADTAARILAHLGFSPGQEAQAPQPPSARAGGRTQASPVKLISVRALRAARPKKTKTLEGVV